MTTITNIICGALMLTAHLNVEQHNIYGDFCKNCHCNWEGVVDPKVRDEKLTNIVLHVVESNGESRVEYLPRWGSGKKCDSYLVFPQQQCVYPIVGHYLTTNVVWTARPAK